MIEISEMSEINREWGVAFGIGVRSGMYDPGCTYAHDADELQ